MFQVLHNYENICNKEYGWIIYNFMIIGKTPYINSLLCSINSILPSSAQVPAEAGLSLALFPAFLSHPTTQPTGIVLPSVEILTKPFQSFK